MNTSFFFVFSFEKNITLPEIEKLFSKPLTLCRFFLVRQKLLESSSGGYPPALLTLPL